MVILVLRNLKPFIIKINRDLGLRVMNHSRLKITSIHKDQAPSKHHHIVVIRTLIIVMIVDQDNGLIILVDRVIKVIKEEM